MIASGVVAGGMVRLTELDGFNDRICDLIGGEGIDGDGEVGSSIEGKAALVTGGEVCLVRKNGPNVVSASAARQGSSQADLKMNEQCSRRGEQQRACGWMLNGAAAESEDQVVAAGEVCNGGMLAVAECLFSMAGEDFGDGKAGLRLDDVVDVGECPAEAQREQRAYGAFA